MTIDIGVLQSVPYFSNLDREELESIRPYVFERSYRKGDLILLEEEEEAEAVYFVVSGAAKAFKTSAEGKEQILCILRAGESFNDVPVFDGGPNPASVTAMTPLTLYGVGKLDVEAILRGHPNVAMNVIRLLAEKVRHFVGMVEDLSFRHVTGRVARLLLKYAGDHQDGGGSTPGPRLTQQDMAAMVGTAREVVGRSLKALEEDGAIKMDRHRIVIADKELLERMSGAVS